jgi:hypothetical protein
LDTLMANEARARAIALMRAHGEHFFLDKVRTST